jgi:hypothetical protein
MYELAEALVHYTRRSRPLDMPESLEFIKDIDDVSELALVSLIYEQTYFKPGYVKIKEMDDVELSDMKKTVVKQAIVATAFNGTVRIVWKKV